MLKVKLAFEKKTKVMTNIEKYGHTTCKIQAFILLLFKKLN